MPGRIKYSIINGEKHKACTSCYKLYKAEDDTYFRYRSVHKDGTYALQSNCRACENIKNLARHHKKYKGHSHRVVSYRYSIKKLYGLDEGTFNEKYAEQGGKCSICGSIMENVFNKVTGKRVAVDHCHDTLAVRGLLCTSCNSAIGLLKEDTKILTAAITYIDKWKTK